MFGSTNPFGQSSSSPFGQPSSSPFGTQPVFGQTSTANSNPFAPKPFGSPTTPFGAQTGSTLFGSTSTGVFGQPSTPTFGASSASPFGSSTPAFGASSTPAFGASSTPAFGSTSSTFGSGSLFGQKPSFGAFGSSPSQSSPFGSTFQQTQPTFGSSAFGATSTPSFGATSTPAFGATSTPAFGASSTPTFGSTAFGSSSTPAFGSPSTTTAFGASSTPGFGASSTPAFGTSTSPFSFGSTPSFGQTSATFGSTPFGTTPPFGAQTSPFGSQTTAPTFGQSPFGAPAAGTRIQPYTQTQDADSAASGTQPAGKLDSISAMPAYKDKSHEELRWEDYQRGDKGGPNPSGQPAVTSGFAAPQQPNAFASTGGFSQTTNLFSSTSTNNPFAAKPSPFASTGFGSTSTSFSSPFGTTAATSSSPFASSTTSLFGPTSGSAFAATTSPSLFANTSPSIFGTSMANTGSSFGTGLSLVNTQSSGLFQSSPAFGPQPFGQASSGFPSNTPAFSTGSLFSTPTPGMAGGPFSSAPSPLFPTTIFQQSAPAQTQSAFSFLPQTQAASTGGFLGASNTMNQSIFGQSTPSQSNMVMQPALVSNPFGTLPAMPQMSIGHVGSSPSVQYGIASLPVAEKPLPSRTLSMVVPRHLSQRRIKLLPRKYNPKADGPKVPFFADEEEAPSTPKADAFFIPRENPRNLIIRPIEQWPPRNMFHKQSAPKDAADFEKHNGKTSDEPCANDLRPEDHHYAPAEKECTKAALPTRLTLVENGIHCDDHVRKDAQAVTLHENGTAVERLMPKLSHADYFTEPQLEELAAKERAEPGYCRRVKDFVVGRHCYGSIKFLGETDVRGLDLESIVEFNNREVIVYKDDNKKPQVGEGLNKPAEVTLLNIKCMNKKTGEQYVQGLRVDKYKEMLVKKAEEQGAEFVSFDAAKGEWKFRVKHFSSYGFGEASSVDFMEC